MNIIKTTRTLTNLIGLASLLALSACSSDRGGTDSESGASRGAASATCGEESEDGASDKILCSVDADCDADEICTEGRCAGLDGDVEDEDSCDEAGEDDADEADEDDADEAGEDDADEADEDDADEADEDDADEADEDDANDKIVCSVDADCDADEVCTDGLCD